MINWLRLLLLPFAGLLLVLPAMAASFDVAQLMDGLARQPGGLATFTETRHLALLDKPLVSTGEMHFTPPDRLEMRTLTPKPEYMLLDRDRITLERDQRRMTIRLGSRPEVLAFVDSVRGLLAGNRVSMERNYLMQLQGEAARWVLTLYPKDAEIAALIQRITVSGTNSQIRTIEYLQADGDRSVLAIEPVKP
ncbi:MAG: acyltransferase [Betaproteobacteria bacterium HGW-Betaproteobacteria-16]|nr:MAG: acyltransferase [Betaproteobacteria bacterium HGW-Betaproteobacteria-16]